MTAALPRTEGHVDVGPGRVWYESVGEGPALLLLHGGPGSPSDDLIPLMVLAADGYRVVRYDQLGSRRSDLPDDPSLWTPERFVAEVETVRQALGLGRMHLFGQSWGGMLALDYALAFPANLASLIISGSTASVPQCVEGMNRLRDALPSETVAIMRRHEAAGTVDDPEYAAAVDILLRRHLCRLDPWPDLLVEAMQHMSKPVYETMWGPNEFTCTGTLRNWDRTDRLGEIRVPTLILGGRYDEVVPECAATLHAGIAGSESVTFEESSHLAFYEEPGHFLAVMRDFLRRSETADG